MERKGQRTYSVWIEERGKKHNAKRTYNKNNEFSPHAATYQQHATYDTNECKQKTNTHMQQNRCARKPKQDSVN